MADIALVEALANHLIEIIEVGSILTTFGIGWGKIKSRLDYAEQERSTMKGTLAEVGNSLDGLHVSLERISVALWGIDSTNGLRGEMRESKEALKALRLIVESHLRDGK